MKPVSETESDTDSDVVPLTAPRVARRTPVQRSKRSQDPKQSKQPEPLAFQVHGGSKAGWYISPLPYKPLIIA